MRFHKGNNYTRKPHKNTVKITTLNAFDVGQLETKAQQKENKSRLEQKGAREKSEARQKLCASEWRR